LSILSVNSGSSSLKVAVHRVSPAGEHLEGTCAIESVGAPQGRLVLQRRGTADVDEAGHFPDQRSAFQAALAKLATLGLPATDGVGHRFVFGGTRYARPCRIDDAFREQIRAYVSFAPAHLPAEIAAVDAVTAAFGDVPQVACFDTAFHRNMPERASRLALPRELWDEGIRNFGFHGLSFEYIVGELAGAPGRTVIAHLGNGASLAAVRDGKAVDTTMGLTPLSGLVMGSRCGDLDPGVVLYLLREKHYDAARLERLLDAQSGMLAISGTSSDVRRLLATRGREPHAAQALEIFCYSACKHIAAMAAALGGMDTLVFTGGIGEHAAALRSEICSGLGFLGIDVDTEANARNEQSIGSLSSAVRILVIHTDEDRMIARHTFGVLANAHAGFVEGDAPVRLPAPNRRRKNAHR
jgi:acetate kinase